MAARYRVRRVAGTGDVGQVQFGAAADRVATGPMIEAGEGVGLLLHPLEKRLVLDQRHFDCLGQPGDLVAPGQAGQQLKVVDDRGGGIKAPSKFFWPKALMPFFTPIPASFWASTVLGMRIRRMPRWKVAQA